MILTIDNALYRLSCALFDKDKMIFEFSTGVVKKQLSVFFPTLKHFFEGLNLNFKNISLISVTSGPGSFTGIRLSLAFAKTLSQIFNIKIATCSTLEVIARNIKNTDCITCPIIDAKKKEIYAAFFKSENNEVVRIFDDEIYSIDRLVDRCLKLDGNIIFTGDGINIYKNEIYSSLKDKASFADCIFWYPENYNIAKIGEEKLNRGDVKNYKEVKPVYLTEFRK